MGEHLPCKQGVMGSNPIISTNPEGRVARNRHNFNRKVKKTHEDGASVESDFRLAELSGEADTHIRKT